MSSERRLFIFMKKRLLGILLGLILVIIGVTACGNQQIFDTTYSFERAIIQLQNGDVIDGEVTSWTDYENSDQIQVTIDGKTYLVHSSNITLISEQEIKL